MEIFTPIFLVREFENLTKNFLNRRELSSARNLKIFGIRYEINEIISINFLLRKISFLQKFFFQDREGVEFFSLKIIINPVDVETDS